MRIKKEQGAAGDAAHGAEKEKELFFITLVIGNGGKQRRNKSYHQKGDAQGVLVKGCVDKLPPEQLNRIVGSGIVVIAGHRFVVGRKYGGCDDQVVYAVGPVVHSPAIDDFLWGSLHIAVVENSELKIKNYFGYGARYSCLPGHTRSVGSPHCPFLISHS